MSIAPLLKKIKNCTACAAFLPCGVNPVLRVGSAAARLLIIGQAPGLKVHQSSIPWDDASGTRLRDWLGLDTTQFYDESIVAIMPMGFCYPGKGTSGDLPPRPECAPLWHEKILQHLPNVKLTLLIGQYAQNRYLGDKRKENVTETVRAWQTYQPSGFLPLVHPSPRNGIWLSKNPWFEKDLVPKLQKRVKRILE